MFTDGLDHAELQWVRKEQPAPLAENLSASLFLDPAGVGSGRRTGKVCNLPPPNGYNVHIHSSSLRPFSSNQTTSTTEDLEESVGSISEGGGLHYDDLSEDTGEEHTSGIYSGSSSPVSPYGNGVARNGARHKYVESERTYEDAGFDIQHAPGRQFEDEGFRESAYVNDLSVKGAGEVYNGDWDPKDGTYGAQIEARLYGGDVLYGKPGGGLARHPEWDREDGAFEENLDTQLQQESFIAAGRPSEGQAYDGVLEELEATKRSNRSPADSLGLPPSAPPLHASIVIDASPQSGDRMSGFPQKSTSRTYSFQTEENPRSVKLPTSRSISGFEEISLTTRQTSYTPQNVANSVTQPAPQNVTNSVTQPAPLYLCAQAAWNAVIAYDACVRLCLRAWSQGCVEAPQFLNNECALLRDSFSLQQVLLPSRDDVRTRCLADDGEATAASKPRRNVGKVKVQVRKVKMMLRMNSSKPPSFSGNLAQVAGHSDAPDAHVEKPPSNKLIPILTGWATVRKLRFPRVPSHGTASQRSMAYVNAGAQYMRQVSGLLKDKVNSLRQTASNEGTQEAFTCTIKLKSSQEDDVVRVQPGSGQMAVFLPESTVDDLLLDVHDSQGALHGRLVVQLASISDDPNDRVRWWNVYSDPERECVGKIQLMLSYTNITEEVGATKWNPVAETLAYDLVLEVAMRVQHFQSRNLRIDGSWKWLLQEFAGYYGVSDAYRNLRYLACIMDVATPTEDCLLLIYDLLCPVVKGRDENALSRQEKRILADVEDQVTHLLATVFENYKSLDESSPSGIAETFAPPAAGVAAPALVPAVQIFTLMHDILSVEAKMQLRTYFQTAAKIRCKRHMCETDEFVSGSSEGFLMDPVSVATAYQKMRVLCSVISNEIRTDIDIHNQHILPSSIDLRNIAAGIYSLELCNRLRTFLMACPPTSPSAPVTELLIATADFQRDVAAWGISPFQGGVDAKDLFHLYIVLWIQDKRLQLLDICKFDKVRWSTASTVHSTSPFVEEVYERIKDTLNEYETIVSRWPEYTIALENAITDVERAVLTTLEKHNADVLTPLKEVMIPKRFSLQYMQKLTRRRSLSLYSVPSQLGVMLNSIKRLLDVQRPKIEAQMRGWLACLPTENGTGGKGMFGERFNEVTVELRAKYKNYLQAIVDKMADNSRLQRTTKLKKILQDTREAGGEAAIRERMQPLSTQLADTICHLHNVLTTRVFVAVCRGYWDRMARELLDSLDTKENNGLYCNGSCIQGTPPAFGYQQEVLNFLENRKENRSWYKGSCLALGTLDDVFASQMQRLQGHALQEKDLEPPRSVLEARSMLSKDVPNGVDSTLFY